MSDTSTSGTAVPAALPASALEGAERFDVVVVGFGIAGGSAALEAARAGARVLLLERAAVHGGTSAMSGGHFYLGGGTPVQQATGHEDSAEEMYKYLVAVSKEPEHDKIRAYCDGSVEHFGWLEALGFEFERSYYPEKAVIQPGTQGLMFTGNEKVWPYKEQARPAPRGHKVPVAGDTEGTKMVMDLLRDRLAEAGAEVRYETGVMNPDMVAAHTPALGSKLFTLGSTYDDGLGIRLGESVGAELKHMDEPFITAPVYPPASLLTGIIVNKHGQRFVAEDSYHSRTSQHVMEQPDSAAYVIVDSEHGELTNYSMLVPIIDAYDTIAELEQALELPEGSVQETLARYNEHAAKGEDPDFHKSREFLAPQDAGPWAAFDLRLGKAMYAGFTLGGMRTDLDGRVQRPDGSVVTGLYAAGACASNIAQDGKGYCSGTQLGEGSFFGRRAGRHAAGVAAGQGLSAGR